MGTITTKFERMEHFSSNGRILFFVGLCAAILLYIAAGSVSGQAPKAYTRATALSSYSLSSTDNSAMDEYLTLQSNANLLRNLATVGDIACGAGLAVWVGSKLLASAGRDMLDNMLPEILAQKREQTEDRVEMAEISEHSK